jgi:hypothetical protein
MLTPARWPVRERRAPPHLLPQLAQPHAPLSLSSTGPRLSFTQSPNLSFVGMSRYTNPFSLLPLDDDGSSLASSESPDTAMGAPSLHDDGPGADWHGLSRSKRLALSLDILLQFLERKVGGARLKKKEKREIGLLEFYQALWVQFCKGLTGLCWSGGGKSSAPDDGLAGLQTAAGTLLRRTRRSALSRSRTTSLSTSTSSSTRWFKAGLLMR